MNNPCTGEADGEYDDRPELEEVLAHGIMPTTQLPAFRRYCDLFFKFFKKAPYHRKREYDQGFIAPSKKKYKRKDGFYDRPCFEDLVALHLDHPTEVYYWLGLRFGRKSKLKCIDFDNKDHLLGYYGERGHTRPVVHMPLNHFKSLKRIYDVFPNHVWCVSSATMGLHIWERLRYAQDAAVIERQNRPRLVRIGLPRVEVYPSPKLIHQVFRRPFGRDYYTITDDGALSVWQEQLEFFESARQSPRFASIVRCVIELMRAEWDRWYWAGGFRPCKESPFAYRDGLYRSKLDAEIDEILTWLEAGCPVEPPQVAPETVERALDVPYQLNWDRLKSGGNGWSWQNVKELARHGVPEEHKLHKFLLMLARPLLFRDYYDLDLTERLQRTEDDLWFWVRNRHNGLVTRCLDGRFKEVRAEVKQQVKKAFESASPNLLNFYAQMRENDAAHPEKVEKLSDIIRDKDNNTSSFSSCCKCINKEADDTPLPDEVAAVVQQIIRDKRMRQRGGEYPFAKFARRLLNALWQEDGVASINRETILAFCDSKNPNQQLQYKQYMAEYGLISGQWVDHVVRGVSSAVYEMPERVYVLFQQHHKSDKPKRQMIVPLRTALIDVDPASIDFGW